MPISLLPENFSAMRLSILGAGMCLFVSCTSIRALETTDPVALEKELHPGDHVLLTAVDGRRYELDFVSIESDGIRGKQSSVEEDVSLPCSELRSVEVESVDWRHTVGLTLVLGVMTVVLISPFTSGSYY